MCPSIDQKRQCLDSCSFCHTGSRDRRVHIAPGTGQEDYEIGLKYGLDNYAPVDDAGKFTEDVENYCWPVCF